MRPLDSESEVESLGLPYELKTVVWKTVWGMY